MNTFKRLLTQILIWLFIWLLFWAQQYFSTNFINENIYVYIAQIGLLNLLIYYNVPFFLFQKKYGLFLVISFAAIVLFTYASYIPIKNTPMPFPDEFPKPPRIENERFAERIGERVNGRSHRPPSRLLANAMFLILTYVIGTVIEFVFYTHKREEEITINKNENLQTELKLLKSQINPHFLFNSLNNIYALSAINVTKTQQSISYLSDMLRYVLYECESPFVPLTKEITYIEDYIKLFTLKSSKTYPIETNFMISDNSINIAPMLLIPFVENAFKHSNIEKINNTFIKINITTNKDSISFRIENSVGKKEVVKDSVGGIGVENVKKRLSILYPEKHSLEIYENENLFKVELNLKYNV